MLADVPVPAPNVTAAILSSSVLAGVLAILGKSLDLIGSRNIARRQRSLDTSGLVLQLLQVPTRGTRYLLLRGMLIVLSVYFVAWIIAFIVSIPITGFHTQLLPFLGAFLLGLLLSVWILARTWQATKQVIGTFTEGVVQLGGSKSDVMERCRYAFSRIGAVVISYELETRWIRAQRGRLGQEVIVSAKSTGGVCIVNVTSASAFQLLPGDLDFGVNDRNVRRFASILVGAARGGGDTASAGKPDLDADDNEHGNPLRL